VTEDRTRRLTHGFGVGKTNVILRELYRSVVKKRELSNTANLSVYTPVFVPILLFGHKSWAMTERVIS